MTGCTSILLIGPTLWPGGSMKGKKKAPCLHPLSLWCMIAIEFQNVSSFTSFHCVKWVCSSPPSINRGLIKKSQLLASSLDSETEIPKWCDILFKTFELFCQCEFSAFLGSKNFLHCWFHRKNALIYSHRQCYQHIRTSTEEITLVWLFARYSQYCSTCSNWNRLDCQVEDLCRNWNTSQGQVAEEGSSLFWETGSPKRSWVKTSLSRDQSTLAERHTEPSPSADSKATLREVLVLVAQSCPTLCDLMVCPWNSPGENTGVGCHFLLQGIFPTQGLNPGLLHCRQILYHLSHQKRYCKETSSQVPGLLSRATSQHSGEHWLLALGCCLVIRKMGSSRGCRSEGTPTSRCRLIGRRPLLMGSPRELAPSRVPTSQILEVWQPTWVLDCNKMWIQFEVD